MLTGGRDPKRGRIHALSQKPESPALRTSVCDAARTLRIGADLLHETLRGRAKVEPPDFESPGGSCSFFHFFDFMEKAKQHLICTGESLCTG